MHGVRRAAEFLGGTAFNSGTGSTKRADCIAQPNERAGITCHLVNGVCHQAAQFVVDEYANVLTREELQAYFGLEESEQPTLPIDQL